ASAGADRGCVAVPRCSTPGDPRRGRHGHRSGRRPTRTGAVARRRTVVAQRPPSDKETAGVSSPGHVLRTGGARRTECDPAATDRPPNTSFGRRRYVSVVAMIDSTGSAIYAALNGLSARQRVIADNVANIETPGYIA